MKRTTSGTPWTDGIELTNEFAAVRVSLDQSGKDPRLLVRDLETGAEVLLEPLELASFCQADDDDRAAWLRVGNYRPTDEDGAP